MCARCETESEASMSCKDMSQSAAYMHACNIAIVGVRLVFDDQVSLVVSKVAISCQNPAAAM
jgi:hypothetical protein